MVLLAAGVAVAAFEALAIPVGVVATMISLLCLFSRLRQPLGYGLWFL
jgi:hypothetical protein